ncbi:MAG: ABC transporter permease, partial [Desulfobacteraceae bacterium]|nr:ABC transporter permease [Desulfobacteraceae bacterium]
MLPLVLLFIFGYGLSLDAENVPIAVVFKDNGSAARDLAARFDQSSYFKTIQLKSMAEAMSLLNQRRIDGIAHIQSDFSSRLFSRNPSPVQVIVNGIDANRARLIQGYARGVLQKWTALRQARGEQVAVPAVKVSQRIWFNEAAVSRNFLVPGLITLIMTLIGILLTALVVAREWERGTMEAILVTPIRRIDLLLGKVLPYFILGMLGMGLSVLVGTTLFHVP